MRKLLILFFFIPIVLQAQQNNIYLELGGTSIGSINYERYKSQEPNIDIGFRIGLGGFALYDFNLKFNPEYIIPLSINFLYGKKHKMELGLGQLTTSLVKLNQGNTERETNIYMMIYFGYRYEWKRFFVRATCHPILTDKNTKHWAGISIGYKL